MRERDQTSARTTVITGALLDSGSDRSYCTRSLVERLKAKGKSITLSVGTIMSEETKLDTEEVNLVVTSVGVRKNKAVTIPQAVVVTELPSSLKDSVAAGANAEMWTHLQGIVPRHPPGEVDILIGLDVPQALMPLEVRSGARPRRTAT